MSRLFLAIAAYLSLAAAPPTPTPRIVPTVFRADVATVQWVRYGDVWWQIGFDFRSRLYQCPDRFDEHLAWTGTIESWDAATTTLVFQEASVVCRPDALPRSGPVSMVRMIFSRCPTDGLVADVDGGSWGRTRVTFR